MRTALAFTIGFALAFIMLVIVGRAGIHAAPVASKHANQSEATETPTYCPLFWRTVPSTSQNGATSTVLLSVSAVFPAEVWAVGYSNVGGSGGAGGIIEKWNGLRWSIVPTPQFYQYAFRGVAMASIVDGWAVGDYDNGSVEPLILNWNGANWSQVATPQPGLSGTLSAVAAVAENDAWAVGTYLAGSGSAYENHPLILHWDGTAWNKIASPNGPIGSRSLVSISVISAADIWAVGNNSYMGMDNPLVEHWDGSNWSIAPGPDSSIVGHLNGVSALADDNVWVVGSSLGGGVALHWNGSGWINIPIDGGSSDTYLTSVAQSANGELWVVGYDGTFGAPLGIRTLILYGGGSKLYRAISPNLEQGENELNAVAIEQPWAWVVGSSSGISTNEHTLVATYLYETCCLHVYTDMQESDYFYDPVQYLSCIGAISGYSDNTFRPNRDTTRGQLAKILVVAEGFPIDTTGGPHFSDVPQTQTFYQWIETAYNRGLISGYPDGTFRPQNNITRAQLAKVAVLAQGWLLVSPPHPDFSDVPAGSTFYSYVETAFAHSIIGGYSDGTFRPGNPATRGQIAKVVFKAISLP